MDQCVFCGSTLSARARFCPNCGKPLQTSTVVATPETITAQRPNASGMNAIRSTLFIVPEHFAHSMQAILDLFGVQPAGLLHDADGTRLLVQGQNVLRNAPIGTIRFVCIIGDWNDIPPVYVPNDLISDGDEFCLSDAFYGATEDFDPVDPLTAVPDIPVGRIPVADSSIVRRVLTADPDVSVSRNSFQYGVTAECWKEATQEIVTSFSNLPQGVSVELPPEDAGTLPKSAIISSPQWTEAALRQIAGSGPMEPFGLILFNVHGGADEPHWVGEGEGGYVHIFRPDTVSDFNSALLVSEACYGGAMSYDSPSIVEQFFQNGGNSFVGSSTIAYGAPATPISAADLIAKHYVIGLYEGLTQGEALKVAKLEALAEDPLSVEVGLKTALSFNLFGAPWQTLVLRPPASATPSSPSLLPTSSAGRPMGSVLNRVRSNLGAPTASNTATIDKFRDHYRARLPPRNRQFILEREDLLQKIREFRDFSSISEAVVRWGGSLEDSKLDCVSAGGALGFRLFCHTKTTKTSKRTLILSINKSGQLIKTVASKGKL
jgi:hypothetical protein